MSSKLAIHGGPRAVPEGIALTFWPIITEEDRQALLTVLDRRVLAGVFGPESVGLEKDFTKFIGSKYAITTGSGTSAIHCALFAAGVGPGDEVITTAFSFSGSFHPILQQNGIPVFVDIDPRTFNIDVNQIEAKITDKTKALLPVHIHGLPADMDEIVALAEKYNLAVIEDACQAHGAEYKGRKAGTIGNGGAFSLNWTKNLSGGEGGIMVTDDEDFLERAGLLRTFGEKRGEAWEKPRPYTVFTVGYQYRNQELPAAFAPSQLKRLKDVNQNTIRNCEYLTEQLGSIRGLVPPYVPDDRVSVYYRYRVRFQPDVLGLTIPSREFRTRLVEALNAEGVRATVWVGDPLPAYPIFQDKVGWGKGCPWSCQHYGRDITYSREDYPETVKLLDESILIGDEEAPLYCQNLELMELYIKAIRKVFENLDELVN